MSLLNQDFFSVELFFQKMGEVMKKTILTVVVASTMCIGACMPTVVSSRPRALPPQPLTDPDVNLSIHPALIVQPQAAGPTASVQTGKETAYESAASTGLHGVGDHETSCISAWPTSQV